MFIAHASLEGQLKQSTSAVGTAIEVNCQAPSDNAEVPPDNETPRSSPVPMDRNYSSAEECVGLDFTALEVEIEDKLPSLQEANNYVEYLETSRNRLISKVNKYKHENED